MRVLVYCLFVVGVWWCFMVFYGVWVLWAGHRCGCRCLTFDVCCDNYGVTIAVRCDNCSVAVKKYIVKSCNLANNLQQWRAAPTKESVGGPKRCFANDNAPYHKKGIIHYPPLRCRHIA